MSAEIIQSIFASSKQAAAETKRPVFIKGTMPWSEFAAMLDGLKAMREQAAAAKLELKN